MAFELPELPFAHDALEPHMSKRTLEFHHGKHHKGYVDKLNSLIEGTQYAGQSLEDIIRGSAQNESEQGIFNNAAQVWNHTFFWHSLSPSGGGQPSGELGKMLEASFGDLASFKKKLTATAMAQFGSGWVWLTVENGKLDLLRTANAVNPLVAGQTPLLTLDVWEHAYYLDYQNRRADFADTYTDHLINWDFAAQNLANA
jgi:Fe-Mn family superoxide dismutase